MPRKKQQAAATPFTLAQKVLSGRWTLYILYLLRNGPVRFNELQRLMPGKLTHTTLSRHLKAMEKDGLVLRQEYNRIPPHVEYSLTEVGTKLCPALEHLEAWSDVYYAHHLAPNNDA